MKINGKPVVDATEPLTLLIEDQDICGSIRKAPTNCAAARAITRTVTCLKASVHLDRTYIEEKDRVIRYRTPGSLRNEIIAIDRGGQFMPGEHELKVLPPHQKPTGKRMGGQMYNGQPTTKSGRKVRRKFARKNHRIEGVREKGSNR